MKYPKRQKLFLIIGLTAALSIFTVGCEKTYTSGSSERNESLSLPTSTNLSNESANSNYPMVTMTPDPILNQCPYSIEQINTVMANIGGTAKNVSDKHNGSPTAGDMIDLNISVAQAEPILKDYRCKQQAAGLRVQYETALKIKDMGESRLNEILEQAAENLRRANELSRQ